jgi:tRNA(adenine34) deaminase
MDDRYWMERALQEARLALEENEVPVGAVLVKDDILVAADHNRTRQLSNPLAHAEKLCIEKVLAQGESHLYQYTLYVTLEPCVMCAGAIIWSRVGRVVFGASDDKAGAAGSIYNVLLDKSFNHHPQLRSGVMARECGAILSEFFAARRQSRS